MRSHAHAPPQATTHSTAPFDTSVYYLDGVPQVTTLQYPWSIAPSMAALSIGSNGAGGEFFAGSMSELRVYSRALSSQEVLTLSQPPFASYPNVVVPTLVAGATTYTAVCQPGYFGPNVTFTKSAATGAWTLSAAVSCTACPAGSYSITGNTTACTLCAGGFFGAFAATPSATCSGTCNAGCVCPPPTPPRAAETPADSHSPIV